MTSAEIKLAMINRSCIEYKGVKYERIAAYTCRTQVLPGGDVRIYTELELVDRENKGCVIIADPKDVKISE